MILLQTAPIGFAAVGWKYFLVVICWSACFVVAIYFYWPETARLSLEEIGKQFGDEVAVHVVDATDEEKAALDRKLIHGDTNVASTTASDSPTRTTKEESDVL